MGDLLKNQTGVAICRHAQRCRGYSMMAKMCTETSNATSYKPQWIDKHE